MQQKVPGSMKIMVKQATGLAPLSYLIVNTPEWKI
jgi:hypothetical protein